MKKILILIGILASFQSIAQVYKRDLVSSKLITLYTNVLQKMSEGSVQEAIPQLQKIVILDSNFLDAQLSLAGAYGELKNYKAAITYYEKAIKKDSIYGKPYLLPYSINLAGNGQFTEALQAVTQFLSIPSLNYRSIKSAQYRQRCYNFAIQYQKNHPNTNYIFLPINLGDSINSAQSEYYPSVSIDDSLLVFTRRGEGYREDFMQSNLHKGIYTKAKEINGDINIEPSKGGITVSADGEWLLFAGNFKNGLGDFDLYISYLTPEGWSEPENLGPTINSEYWDSSPSISPDNYVLYFSSNRPGGYGGKDLYYSIRQKNGRWSPAKNMGPQINSAGDEMAPYIHADNQTLYFTSDGLPGYGGTDLFICRKNNDGSWSNPENLGYPINTIENEGSICISSDGLTAYYASDKSDSRGGLDLYKFKLRKDIQPNKTLYIKGKVFDASTKKGLPSGIDLVDNNTQQTIMHIQTDEKGKYFVPLPSGKNYTFTVNRKGYLFYSEVYNLQDNPSDSTYQKDIPLQAIAVNTAITLKNVQFNSNSFNLLPVSKIELDKLVEILKDDSTVHIQVNGHTDNIGNAEANATLSKNRALSVAQYLVNQGIEANRILYKGLGDSKPIADNNTEEGRAKNRRTEIVVVGL